MYRYIMQCSRVRPKCSMVRLKKIWGRTGTTSHSKKKKKVSATLKVSLWFNNRHTLGPYCGLNQSEIVKGAPPSDWPWCRYSCTCVYVWKCVCCCSQTEREASRLATFQLTRLLINRLLVNIAYMKIWVHLTFVLVYLRKKVSLEPCYVQSADGHRAALSWEHASWW